MLSSGKGVSYDATDLSQTKVGTYKIQVTATAGCTSKSTVFELTIADPCATSTITIAANMLPNKIFFTMWGSSDSYYTLDSAKISYTTTPAVTCPTIYEYSLYCDLNNDGNWVACKGTGTRG